MKNSYLVIEAEVKDHNNSKVPSGTTVPYRSLTVFDNECENIYGTNVRSMVKKGGGVWSNILLQIRTLAAAPCTNWSLCMCLLEHPGNKAIPRCNIR